MAKKMDGQYQALLKLPKFLLGSGLSKNQILKILEPMEGKSLDEREKNSSSNNRGHGKNVMHSSSDEVSDFDDNFDYPKISKVVVFDTNSGNLLQYGRGRVYDCEEFG